MSNKKDIRLLEFLEIQCFCKSNGLPNFRAKQVWEWLWKKKATSFKEMTSLSKQIRDLFTLHFTINPIKIYKAERSIDGTIKYSLQLQDKLLIESVLIPSKKRLTACISSQVGCSLTCNFCATGTLKLDRNLTTAEIYDQVFILNEEAISNFGKPLSNIVYMGMGEPLVNYQNVVDSVKYIINKDGLNISSKRITLSTVGVSKMIRKLADEELKINLAVSLHSANNVKRTKIMDINSVNDLDDLKNALIYFFNKTKIKITYEYIMLKDFNDTKKDALDLIKFCKIIPSKVNLIEFNTVKKTNFMKSSDIITKEFIEILKKEKIIVNLRKSRGEDVNAACGQLANTTDSFEKNH